MSKQQRLKQLKQQLMSIESEIEHAKRTVTHIRETRHSCRTQFIWDKMSRAEEMWMLRKQELLSKAGGIENKIRELEGA